MICSTTAKQHNKTQKAKHSGNKYNHHMSKISHQAIDTMIYSTVDFFCSYLLPYIFHNITLTDITVQADVTFHHAIN